MKFNDIEPGGLYHVEYYIIFVIYRCNYVTLLYSNESAGIKDNWDISELLYSAFNNCSAYGKYNYEGYEHVVYNWSAALG